jgi:hypothetical protein
VKELILMNSSLERKAERMQISFKEEEEEEKHLPVSLVRLLECRYLMRIHSFRLQKKSCSCCLTTIYGNN